jgi:hypothetical protein
MAGGRYGKDSGNVDGKQSDRFLKKRNCDHTGYQYLIIFSKKLKPSFINFMVKRKKPWLLVWSMIF